MSLQSDYSVQFYEKSASFLSTILSTRSKNGVIPVKARELYAWVFFLCFNSDSVVHLFMSIFYEWAVFII